MSNINMLIRVDKKSLRRTGSPLRRANVRLVASLSICLTSTAHSVMQMRGSREREKGKITMIDRGASALEIGGDLATARKASPLLTVIVPAYNEVDTIDESLSRVLAAPCEKQIIVVDDGSQDGTVERLAEWESRGAGIEVYCHRQNRGKGSAIRTALEHANGMFVIIQDADLEYDPQDYGRLLEPLLAGRADVVYGARPLGPSRADTLQRNIFNLGVFVLNFAVRRLYGRTLTDEATCYKVFPTSLLWAMCLECERFEFCPEVTAKACRLGLRIEEVPIGYKPRGIEQGKKIRLRDGIDAILTLWRYRNWQGTWEREPPP